MKVKREPSEFEKRVYKEISKIPKGAVITYGELAKKLKSHPRAVGQALKRNPYAPIVPCHRVIHTNGKIGGYNGIKNSKKKIKLLKNEGVQITQGRVVRGH